jgi:hypothetical protein
MQSRSTLAERERESPNSAANTHARARAQLNVHAVVLRPLQSGKAGEARRHVIAVAAKLKRLCTEQPQTLSRQTHGTVMSNGQRQVTAERTSTHA